MGGLNGLVSGVAGIYEWRVIRGWLCFVLDSTWALPGVAAGVLLHAANVLHPNPSYLAGMSRRANRHVYEGGYSARPGFALALGNVVSGAGGSAGLRGDSERVVRRRKLVDVHEGAHLFQNRLPGSVVRARLPGLDAGGGRGRPVRVAGAGPEAPLVGHRDLRLLRQSIRILGIQEGRLLASPPVPIPDTCGDPGDSGGGIANPLFPECRHRILQLLVPGHRTGDARVLVDFPDRSGVYGYHCFHGNDQNYALCGAVPLVRAGSGPSPYADGCKHRGPACDRSQAPAPRRFRLCRRGPPRTR